MLSNCIIVGESDAAKVKAIIASELHLQGFKQREISKMLNITQPMVSKYLKQSYNDKRLEEAAESIIEMLKNAKKTSKTSFSLIVSNGTVPYGDYFLSTKENIVSKEKSSIISCLAESVEMLKKVDLAVMLPKVKVNIAMAMEKAKSKQDVAAMPSGLVFVKGVLRSNAEPEFGSSTHLASILLYVRTLNKDVKCAMNIKYDKEVLRKIRKSRLKYNYFDHSYRTKKKNFDILIHKGSFGIEPTTYIFGKDAKDAVRKCLILNKK